MTNSRMYWAHSAKNLDLSAESRAGWQLLADHLLKTGQLARWLASDTLAENRHFAKLAELAGFLHDLGKYSDAFQRMLTTGHGHPQHAIHGGIFAYNGRPIASGRPGFISIAAAITGHHAGLADWCALGNKLEQENYQKEVEELVRRAQDDCPEAARAMTALASKKDLTATVPRERIDLYERMLFSCLVDADHLDSAGRKPLQYPLKADERLALLRAHVTQLENKAPEGTVKQMRRRVLTDCLHAASSEKNLFSLSVPTGGGKTLASMAFALRRAALFPKRFRRVIVVIPYLSIIEQNAEVYASIFGHDSVLEHHSGCIQKLTEQRNEQQEQYYVPTAEGRNEEDQFQETGLRPETENWDAPLVVTTSVRFFESLFSNRPADLRRVHNIARSIVILDEVQTLPRRLLGPLLGMMKELAEVWDVNFVFSTATQPAFERPASKRDLRWPHGTLEEIVRDPEELRHALRRVQIDWEIDQPASWAAIATRMLNEPQSLTIVNLREHASQLYRDLLRKAEAQQVPIDAVFHLSTRMCAAHRLRVIERIRQRLRAGERCYVISTQLVEAGVDLDFPLVLRALAPLDAIVQAAGRADREGKLTARLGHPGGRVIVFRPEEHKLPPNEYKEAADITETIALQARENSEEIQVDSAKFMRLYFEQYYGGADDNALGKELIEDRLKENFATLAGKFEMISSRTRDVFVPDDAEAVAALNQLLTLREFTPEGGARWRALRQQLQRHTVGLSPSEFERARDVLEPVELATGEEIWIAALKAYNETLGLTFGIKAEDYVC